MTPPEIARALQRQRIRRRKKEHRQRIIGRIADRLASREPAAETARYVLALMNSQPGATALSYFNMCPPNVQREIKRLFAATKAGQTFVAEAIKRARLPRLS